MVQGLDARATAVIRDMKLVTTIPVLRIFDEAKAHEFYVGFLGFTVEWQHRFTDDLPLYQSLQRDGVVLHLSEHYGDACPGAQVRIEVEDIEALHAELIGKNYKFARPGLEAMPWGMREVRVGDPFGNRITFAERMT
jgi:uncharacterized glyoxalase superfamily protein PhnB